jgi:hypothetical protein
MKIKSPLCAFLLAGAAAASLLLTGCVSTPADRAAILSRNVASAGKDLESSRSAITQALTTLNKLITQPEGDMRGQYKDYLSAVRSLNSISAKVDDSISTLVANSQVYFADWGNQINAMNDPMLKQLSADRKQQAVASLNELKVSTDKARAACKSLARDLQDIGHYLGNNLTASGISAMKPRLDVIKVEAVGVRDAVSAAVSSLNKFSGTLATPAK